MNAIQNQIQIRRQKEQAIAKTHKVAMKDGIWIVPSTTNPKKTYEVTLTLTGATCNCEDYLVRRLKCKHQFAVELTVTKQINRDGTTAITHTKKVIYPQNWLAYDQAAIQQQKELFQNPLNDLCNSIQEPKYTFGRPKLPLRDMAFSSALKVYSTFSLRRFYMKEAQSKGYIEKTPYYSTVARYMESEELTHKIKELILASALPLNAVENSFSIDGTGFSPSKFSRWFIQKYGKSQDLRMKWYKLSALNGNATHIVTSCEVTPSSINDMMMLPQLAYKTHENFDMKELCADKGYISDTNLNYLDRLGIKAFIPFRANTVPDNPKQSQIWRNAYNYFVFNQAMFLEHYHVRSNVETVFHMVKSKFGDALRSKTETVCINEILLKVLCHNICVLISEMFELGIKPEFLSGA